MSDKIKKEIKLLMRLCDSYYNLKIPGIKAVANRYKEFEEELEKYNNTSDIRILKDYAQEIFNKIDWNNSDDNEEISVANRDYCNILVDLLNLFEHNEINHVIGIEEEPERAQTIFNTILKRINNIDV